MLQFGKKGPVAYDISSTSWDDQLDRTVSIGTTAYYSGYLVADFLPKGKTWIKTRRGGALPSVYVQILNPAEPATLAALLDKGKATGNKVTGKITFKDLAWVAPRLDADGTPEGELLLPTRRPRAGCW
ncbi:hypothetical protein [Nonomuraea sp. NPDC005650]|uniref:hypothetical protein n=1 Tax=Nonomuraea sp. NPDC005650 TaxID=3157045 RepID=UPI0033AC6EC8